MRPQHAVATDPVGVAGDEPRPGRHRVFAIVSLAILMSSIDQTIVATALGAIQHDLHTQLNWSTWTITIYALGRVVVLPIAGRISDTFGRRRVFLIAVVLFTLSSLGCGFANDIYTLVALRAVQSIGGGSMMPSATGIVSDQYGRARDKAVGSFTNIVAIGGIIGPVIGGVFVAFLSWRWIFFVNVPIGVLLFFLTIAYIPETRSSRRKGLDGVGAGLFGVGLFAAMLSISILGSKGTSFDNPIVIGGPIIAIVAFGLLVRRSGRVAHPLIPARLLYGPGFGVLNTINFLWGASMLGFGALVPLYAQDRFGVPVLAAGTLLTARAVGIVLVTGLATLALHRTGYRRPIFGGFLLAAIGMALMSMGPHGVSAYTWLAIAAATTGIGMGAAMPASNVAVLSLAKDELASVAGLRAMFRQCGGIVGVAVVSAVVARSSDPGEALAHAFMVFAVVIVCLTPLVFRIPEATKPTKTPSATDTTGGVPVPQA